MFSCREQMNDGFHLTLLHLCLNTSQAQPLLLGFLAIYLTVKPTKLPAMQPLEVLLAMQKSTSSRIWDWGAEVVWGNANVIALKQTFLRHAGAVQLIYCVCHVSLHSCQWRDIMIPVDFPAKDIVEILFTDSTAQSICRESLYRRTESRELFALNVHYVYIQHGTADYVNDLVSATGHC